MSASGRGAEKLFWGGLALLGLSYALIVVPTFSIAYLDFGDGNYLYISARMADGLTLYRDILAPQPPLHLFVGSLLIRLGRVFSDNPETWLYFIRSFSLALHLATMVLVAVLARRFFAASVAHRTLEIVIALLAAFFYLVIPIGFWWTLAYQSEPLMLLFLLGGLLRMLRWDRRGLIEGGLLHLCAVLTNMTAAPYICWSMLFLLVVAIREPATGLRRLAAYALPIIGGWLLVVGGFYLLRIDYLGNVFLNQTGTFAKKEILALNGIDGNAFTYAWGKVKSEGRDVFKQDFFFIIFGVLGLAIHLLTSRLRWLRWPNRRLLNEDNAPPSLAQATKDNESAPEDTPAGAVAPPPVSFHYDRAFICWFVFWTWMSLGFVSKGGTMDYIFTIGEPLLCAFAAFAVVFAIVQLIAQLIAATRYQDHPRLAFAGLGLALIVALAGLQVTGIVIFKGDIGRRYFGGQRLLVDSLRQTMPPMELPVRGVENVQRLIEQHSRPGDPILGPPYYAFIGNRTLYEEYSEIFIWRMKYVNEKIVDRQDGEGVAKVEKIAQALNERRIPLALIDEQLWGIPELQAALIANYRQLVQLQTMNTTLKVFIPGQEND